jgi:hypothetical protein
MEECLSSKQDVGGSIPHTGTDALPMHLYQPRRTTMDDFSILVYRLKQSANDEDVLISAEEHSTDDPAPYLSLPLRCDVDHGTTCYNSEEEGFITVYEYV